MLKLSVWKEVDIEAFFVAGESVDIAVDVAKFDPEARASRANKLAC